MTIGTRFEDVGATPNPVPVNTTVTLEGFFDETLTGNPLPNYGPVFVDASPDGSSNWVVLDGVVTDAAGIFRLGFQFSTPGLIYLRARFPGDATYGPSISTTFSLLVGPYTNAYVDVATDKSTYVQSDPITVHGAATGGSGSVHLVAVNTGTGESHSWDATPQSGQYSLTLNVGSFSTVGLFLLTATYSGASNEWTFKIISHYPLTIADPRIYGSTPYILNFAYALIATIHNPAANGNVTAWMVVTDLVENKKYPSPNNGITLVPDESLFADDSVTFAVGGSHTLRFACGVGDPNTAPVDNYVDLTVTVQGGTGGVLTVTANETPNGLTVSFTGSASGGTSPYTWYWDFGDGQISRDQNPSHTYAAAGTYTVILYAVDFNGLSGAATIAITVTGGGGGGGGGPPFDIGPFVPLIVLVAAGGVLVLVLPALIRPMQRPPQPQPSPYPYGVYR